MVEHVPEKQLARWAAVSLVLSRTNSGVPLSAAIAEVVDLSFAATELQIKLSAKRRTLYRWVAKYKKGGFNALADRSRAMQAPSRCLNDKILDFIRKSKTEDNEATIPDIIRSMETLEIVPKDTLSRTSVWRAARNMGLPIFSGKSKTDSKKLRFSYEHRMQMVLCDGKQFRVGIKRRKRLGFFFIDDASRKIIGVVVGSSENKRLFLRGVMQVIRRYGLMGTIYTDGGSGFIAKDAATVLGRLGINLVIGTEGYPEGRGKIERFNRTLKHDLLRTFDGDPVVDSAYSSLELRCRHYVEECYNTREHDSLSGKSPDERWASDSLDLNIPDNIEDIMRKFIVTKARKVRKDNTFSLDGVNYEVPFGHAGVMTSVQQDLLYGEVSIVHAGKSIVLKEVDVVANSRLRRRGKKKSNNTVRRIAGVQTAARHAYKKNFESVLNKNGDFFEQEVNARLENSKKELK